MPTLTTTFSLNKPLVNDATDQDLWGGYLNDNMDTIDTALKLCRDSIKRTITTTDSVVAGDRRKTLLCDATAAPFTETLLAAATAADGFEVTIVKTDATANAVTIDGNGSETISGALTYALSGQGDAVILQCDGSNWNIKAAKTTPSAVGAASTSAAGIIEIATTAEVQAGASTTLAVTPAALKAAVGFLNYAESSQIALSSGAAGSFTHGLGSTPILIKPILVCVTTDAGWAVDDEVDATLMNVTQSTNDQYGIALGASSSAVYYVMAVGTGSDQVIYGINKTTGARVLFTNSKWKLVIRAWA